jgi:hypothetical protein
MSDQLSKINNDNSDEWVDSSDSSEEPEESAGDEKPFPRRSTGEVERDAYMLLTHTNIFWGILETFAYFYKPI